MLFGLILIKVFIGLYVHLLFGNVGIGHFDNHGRIQINGVAFLNSYKDTLTNFRPFCLSSCPSLSARIELYGLTTLDTSINSKETK